MALIEKHCPIYIQCIYVQRWQKTYFELLKCQWIKGLIDSYVNTPLDRKANRKKDNSRFSALKPDTGDFANTLTDHVFIENTKDTDCINIVHVDLTLTMLA